MRTVIFLIRRDRETYDIWRLTFWGLVVRLEKERMNIVGKVVESCLGNQGGEKKKTGKRWLPLNQLYLEQE